MSGVFPNSGVLASQTLNTVDVATINCTDLFHSTTLCNPRFDPASANAIISEILNVVGLAGNTYDCSQLTNLHSAILAMQTCNCPPGSGVVPPVAAPGAKASRFYIDTAASPDALYWYDGAAWQPVGGGVVVSDNTIDGAGTVGSPLTVPLSTDVNNGLTLGTDGRLYVPPRPPTLVKKGAPIVFTVDGVYTPTGADVIAANVEMVGGGGGTAGASSVNGANASGGASGAGYSQKFIWNPTVATVVIGQGGVGVAAGIPTNDGTPTTYIDTLYTLRAVGGNGGAYVIWADVTSVPYGDDNIAKTVPGAPPLAALSDDSDNHVLGGIGGEAYAFGGNTDIARTGTGGASVFGRGYGGFMGNSTAGGGATGGSGSSPAFGNYGAGASGAMSIKGFIANGGTGADGVVYIQEYTA